MTNGSHSESLCRSLDEQNGCLFHKTDNSLGGFGDSSFLSENHLSEVTPKGCLDLFFGSMRFPGPGSTNKGGGVGPDAQISDVEIACFYEQGGTGPGESECRVLKFLELFLSARQRAQSFASYNHRNNV